MHTCLRPGASERSWLLNGDRTRWGARTSNSGGSPSDPCGSTPALFRHSSLAKPRFHPMSDLVFADTFRTAFLFDADLATCGCSARAIGGRSAPPASACFWPDRDRLHPQARGPGVPRGPGTDRNAPRPCWRIYMRPWQCSSPQTNDAARPSTRDPGDPMAMAGWCVAPYLDWAVITPLPDAQAYCVLDPGRHARRGDRARRTKTKLALLLWSVSPEQPTLYCAAPFVYPQPAALWTAEVEIHFAADAVRLLALAWPRTFPAPTPRAACSTTCARRPAGCAFWFVPWRCTSARWRWRIDPECSGAAGATAFVVRTLDPRWAALVF